MKKCISYLVAVFFAMTVVGLAGADEDAIQAKEKAAWQAFKDKKADDFKKLVDKDYRGVYPEGISTLQKELPASGSRGSSRTSQPCGLPRCCATLK